MKLSPARPPRRGRGARPDSDRSLPSSQQQLVGRSFGLVILLSIVERHPTLSRCAVRENLQRPCASRTSSPYA